jgi:hypothetical protein
MSDIDFSPTSRASNFFDYLMLPPLGIFGGLDLPYAPPKADDSMHKRWDDLTAERNAWPHGILKDLAAISSP